MKDQRKRLIAEGKVDDYDAARLKASTTDWNDPAVREAVNREAAALRVKNDVQKYRRGRSTTRH